MRIKDIKIGESYHHEHDPYSYRPWFAKVRKILKPREGIYTKNYFLVECEWSEFLDHPFSMRKYFRPKDLLKLPNKNK